MTIFAGPRRADLRVLAAARGCHRRVVAMPCGRLRGRRTVTTTS